MTTATIRVDPASGTTVRVRFSDGSAINCTAGFQSFRITTSSPTILGEKAPSDALRMVDRMMKASLGDESVVADMERFRAMAETAETIVDLASKLMETVGA